MLTDRHNRFANYEDLMKTTLKASRPLIFHCVFVRTEGFLPHQTAFTSVHEIPRTFYRARTISNYGSSSAPAMFPIRTTPYLD